LFVSDLDDSKLKRASAGNIGGLFAFPRVGRGDPEMFDWDSLSYNAIDDYNGRDYFYIDKFIRWVFWNRSWYPFRFSRVLEKYY
jgi:hypothetical protein